MSSFWILSYVGSHFALIIATVLAVILLGAVAWFAKNWKVAVAAVAVVVVGLSYQQIDKSAYQRRVAEEAAAQVKTLQGRLNTVNAVNEAYGKRYASDQKELSELRKLARETPANSSPCLDRDAARRVRSIH